VITSGLKPGEQVVTEGNGKLMDGMPVHPHPGQPEQASADQSTGGGKSDAGKPDAGSSEGK
jgi:hypothetical protein